MRKKKKKKLGRGKGVDELLRRNKLSSDKNAFLVVGGNGRAKQWKAAKNRKTQENNQNPPAKTTSL